MPAERQSGENARVTLDFYFSSSRFKPQGLGTLRFLIVLIDCREKGPSLLSAGSSVTFLL